jgi:ketosteroid isomerase-like protein
VSRENVEVVRAGQQAMAAGDVEAALASLDPEVEWHGTVGGLDEGTVYRGHDEVVQAFLAYFETWERIELRADCYVDTAGDDVVVFFHEVARGRESGVVVETDTGTVNTVRGGRIVRVRGFMDRAAALREAGVSRNVELVYAAYEGIAGGDFGPAADAWAPDGEFVPAVAGAVDGNVYRGPAGIRRYFDELLEDFDEFALEDLELAEHGARVLARYRWRLRGRSSGVVVEQEVGALYELRDEKVVWGRTYLSHEEALAALGP